MEKRSVISLDYCLVDFGKLSNVLPLQIGYREEFYVQTTWCVSLSACKPNLGHHLQWQIAQQVLV